MNKKIYEECTSFRDISKIFGSTSKLYKRHSWHIKTIELVLLCQIFYITIQKRHREKER